MKVSIGLLAASVLSIPQYRFAFYGDNNGIEATTDVPRKASVSMMPDASNPLSKGVVGHVEIIQKDKYSPIKVTGQINGLTPNTQHGLHFHQNGLIFPNCTSAGGHFNPKLVDHGAPDDKIHHVGDMGNVRSDQNGVIVLDLQFNFISLFGEDSILARSLVLHEKIDDLGRGVGDLAKTSKLNGNAGTRLSCGVVGRVDY